MIERTKQSGPVFRGTSLAVLAAAIGIGLFAAVPAGADVIAQTGFEPSEAYTDSYDVRYQNHSDLGWDSNWFGRDGGGLGNPFTTDPYTVPIADGTAAKGLQYYRQHRSNAQIEMNRRFPVQFGRVYYTFRVRIDSDRTAPNYLGGPADFYVISGMTSANGSGTRAVHFAFLADGNIQVRGAQGALGTDPIIGKWDGTGSLPSALNAWRKIVADCDIATNTYQLFYDGQALGTFNFRVTGQTSLNGIRYLGPQSASAVPSIWSWGMSIDDVYIGTEPPSGPPDCGSVVVPTATQTSFALLGQAAAPGSIVYTIGNNGGLSHVYTIEETDAGGTPTNYSWLTLDKGTTTIPSMQSDTVTATIDTTGLGPDVYTAYVQFRDDCSPPNSFIRQIELTVEDCRWSVSPNITIGACRSTSQDFLTVTNTGVVDINYTVEEIVDCPWLELTTTGDGPIATGQTSIVGVRVDPTGLPPGDILCDLLFMRDCDPGDPDAVLIRTITLSVFTPIEVAYHGDVDPDAPDSAGIGRTFVLQSGSKLGSVLADPAAYDGKAWRINDTNPASGVREFWRTDPVENLDAQIGSTIVARMKVVSETDSGAQLRLSNDMGASASLRWGGPAGFVTEVDRNVTAAVAGDDEYHIFRLSCGREGVAVRTVNVYIDEGPVPVLTIPYASGIGRSPEGFGFGVLGNTGTADISFDWITATNAGAFAPGEEIGCLGQSLVIPPPACASAPTITSISPAAAPTGMPVTGVVIEGANFVAGQTVARLVRSGESAIPAVNVVVSGTDRLTCDFNLTAAAPGTWDVVVATVGCPAATLANGFTVRPPCPAIPQDVDGDSDVDLSDFSQFQTCFNGPNRPWPESADANVCRCVDADEDGDVDLSDFGVFQVCFNGPNRTPPQPACDNANSVGG